MFTLVSIHEILFDLISHTQWIKYEQVL